MGIARVAPGTAFLLSAFVIALSSPALGQGTTPLPPITVPGTIVDSGAAVTADAVAEDGSTFETTPVDQAQRTDTVKIVDQQEIEDKRSSVAYDVLETKPGLSVVRRLGLTGAGLSRLSIRGNGVVGPAGLQVYVDGRPDATVSFAHPTPSALSTADIESIEVISGPSPVLNGSGKTGAVNIKTADPKKGLHGFIESSYGMYETTQNFASVSYGDEFGYVRVGGSFRSTDGSNPDSDAEIGNINFKGKIQIDEVWDVTFAAARNEDSFNVFREFFVPGPFTDPRTQTLDLTQTVADFTINADFGNVVSSLKFFFDDLTPRSQVVDFPEQRANVEEKGFRFKTAWAVSDQTNIITGVDFLRADAENSPVLPPFGGPQLSIPRNRVHEELDELSFYVFAEQALTNSISVSGGIRHIEHSEYGDEQAGELGILFVPQISDPSNLFHASSFRARATRGYQSPTLQQLFGVFRGGRTGPANPSLGPEIVYQYEVGFNKAFRQGSFDIVAYFQDGDDLIGLPARPTRNPNFPPPPPFLPPPDILNDVEYENYGLEATLQYSLTANLDAMIGVSLNDFDQATNRFLRVPEKTVDFGVIYRTSVVRNNDLSISLYGRYAMDTFDVAFTPDFPPALPRAPREKLDDYFVADLKVNFEANDNTRLFFGIDNITDEDYELVDGIPGTPLSVYGGIRLQM